MSIQQLLLGSSRELVLPLTDVTIFHNVVYLPPNLPTGSARYLVSGNGEALREGVGTVTPDVLPEVWLPEGASAADYRVRFTEISKNPTNTVVSYYQFGGGNGVWLAPSAATFVAVTSEQNQAVGTIYEANIRVDIALASNLNNILGGADITLQMRRTPL